MNRLVWLIGISILTTACGKQIEDFVKEGVKAPVQVVDPAYSNSSAKAIKVSPGSGILSGTQVDGKVTLTMTSRTVSGSQIEARLSFSQNRVQ